MVNKIKIIEESDNKIVFQYPCNLGFATLLVEELWNDKDISAAAFEKEHPQTGTPKFVVETKKGNARDAVKSAIKRLKDKNKEFLKEIENIKFDD